jgi:16S rRNA (guanine966-N2)-methyltransferase
VRIISGTHKGRSIVAPKNLPVRPTTDYAKEALFNILQNNFDFEELAILDLFCGTGNISFEFASRGANHITSVDAHFGCVKFVKETADLMKFNTILCVKSDVFAFLNRCHQTFDLIFADPPYNLQHISDIHRSTFEKNLLKPNGWLIIEHGKDTELSQMEHFLEKRTYGNVNFSIFKISK